MNTDTNVLDKNPVSVPASGSVIQPQVGSLNKEKPISTGGGSSELQPAGPEAEHDIGQELTELGVKETTEKPDLTPEHKKLGIGHAGSNITVITQPPASIELPMSEEEISKQLETGQDDDSGKWLARLIRKIIAWGFKTH